MARLPSGIVTFLFTDIERSTEQAGELGDDRWSALLAEHRRRLRDAFAAHHGQHAARLTDGDAREGDRRIVVRRGRGSGMLEPSMLAGAHGRYGLLGRRCRP
jgi:class 3 adenylate cyclase